MKCVARLAQNTACKNSTSAYHHTNLPGYTSQLRHLSTIGKDVKQQQYLLHKAWQFVELRSTNGWDRLASLGHPSKFQRVSHLVFVTAPTGGQPKFARCLAVSWAQCIHYPGLLLPNVILPGPKFTLRPSVAFYIGSVTACHLSSGREPNFAAWDKEIRQGGHHVVILWWIHAT